MSKFFGTISDSESSSDSSSEHSVEKIKEVKKEIKPKIKKADRPALSDSSDDEPVDRRIQTPAQKLRSGIKKVINDLDNLIKNKEFALLHTLFNSLVEEIKKSSSLIKQCGIPNMLLNALMKLQKLIGETKKEDRNNMTKNNKSNFGTLKNKLTKYIKANFSKELAAYKKNPVESEPEEVIKPMKKKNEVADSDDDSEESSEEEEESEDEDSEKENNIIQTKEDSDEDDIDWGGSEDDSSDSEEENEEEKAKELTLSERRKRWMKSPEEIKAMREGTNLQTGKKKERKQKEAKKNVTEGEGEKDIKEVKFAKEYLLELDFSVLAIADEHLKKMKKYPVEIQNLILNKMLKEVSDKKVRVNVLYFLITSTFSVVKGHLDYYLDREKWVNVISYINELMDLLAEKVEINEKRKDKMHIYKFFESAHKELHTAFQRISPQNIQYIKRLQDEHKLLYLGERVLQYYKDKKEDTHIAKTSLILLNHLYAKHNSLYKKMQKIVEKKSEEEKKKFYIPDPEKTEGKIDELVKNVFEEGYTRSYRIQATLYKIYHHAIHNRFYTARNLMSTSQISEKINKQDENIQILYNRTIVQIGLSAFRIGLFKECFDISKEIANYGHLKELLAQTIKSKTIEKQIRKEKQRFVPYHLHIDFELFDFTHMVCAMLLEIPNISRNELYIKRHIISRPFRKLIDSADNALFNGPPEQQRDYIVYASRSLYHGEWRKALDYLFAANKVWKLIPEFEEVQKVLMKEVKEVAFKVLMFKNSKCYESYSISDLGNLFEMEEEEVKRLVSKLIVRERFNISVKKEENVVQINETPLNEVQSLANVCAQKLRYVLSQNQKIVNGTFKPKNSHKSKHHHSGTGHKKKEKVNKT